MRIRWPTSTRRRRLDARGSSEYSISPPPANSSLARAESLLREYNRSMLKILIIHEAYPGPLRPA